MTLMKLRLDFLCCTVLTFWNTSGGYLSQIFNSQALKGGLTNSPQRKRQKFSKLKWENIARIHLLKSQKYWYCKVLLGIITTTITQLDSQFILYYSSSQCRRLMKLLIKLAQFINSYQNCTLGGPRTKQIVFQCCFLCITEAY